MVQLHLRRYPVSTNVRELYNCIVISEKAFETEDEKIKVKM